MQYHIFVHVDSLCIVAVGIPMTFIDVVVCSRIFIINY